MRAYFRSALPSAYNIWSPWAWDWWLNEEKHDVTKMQKLAREKTSKITDKNQTTEQQSKPKTWTVIYFTAKKDTLILSRVNSRGEIRICNLCNLCNFLNIKNKHSYYKIFLPVTVVKSPKVTQYLPWLSLMKFVFQRICFQWWFVGCCCFAVLTHWALSRTMYFTSLGDWRKSQKLKHVK